MMVLSEEVFVQKITAQEKIGEKGGLARDNNEHAKRKGTMSDQKVVPALFSTGFGGLTTMLGV